jgi:hypothetical protein
MGNFPPPWFHFHFHFGKFGITSFRLNDLLDLLHVCFRNSGRSTFSRTVSTPCGKICGSRANLLTFAGPLEDSFFDLRCCFADRTILFSIIGVSWPIETVQKSSGPKKNPEQTPGFRGNVQRSVIIMVFISTDQNFAERVPPNSRSVMTSRYDAFPQPQIKSGFGSAGNHGFHPESV